MVNSLSFLFFQAHESFFIFLDDVSELTLDPLLEIDYRRRLRCVLDEKFLLLCHEINKLSIQLLECGVSLITRDPIETGTRFETYFRLRYLPFQRFDLPRQCNILLEDRRPALRNRA